ncbi:MAG TPA: aspartate carbamoyltransferase [Bacteroidales bacterium]|jgi:aspartate carbamoyltransferase catalytic subunit|nr:aspartate carbamoyltransferase [Bacteroidales bacterium]HOU97668.1 aspartate carbamoyltransferase [Bacteroidales bacterium]
MKNKSLISIHDYSKENYFKILELAEIFQKNPKEYENLLNGKVIATLFFEPSTRTRLSFESAVQRMGGRIIGFSDPGSSSVQKGESLKDTILTVAQYSDLIVMRHPVEGSARWASEVSPVPIVNAGDGANQHPTQCLLDLFTIKETQHRLENLTLTFVGDLKYGRTVHSLIQAMSIFNPTFHLVSPEALKLPNEYKLMLKEKNIPFYEHTDMIGVLKDSDIVYVTRVQRERFSDPIEYEKVKNAYVLEASMLTDTKPNLKVLHPLPRVNEISIDVDDTEKAYYFQQALNGVYTRMAIISLILGLKN